MTTEPRLYGVSYGNGNDGVSHMFADFYVTTNDPWRLARCATVDAIKEEFQAKALEEMYVDGEAEYTIAATISDPLEDPYCDDGSLWSESNGAWFICEVFPEDEPRDGKPVFDSLEDAISARVLAMIPPKVAP